MIIIRQLKKILHKKETFLFDKCILYKLMYKGKLNEIKKNKNMMGNYILIKNRVSN